MGRLYVVSLEGSFYSCKHCKTHLGLSDDIISKLLMGKCLNGSDIAHSDCLFREQMSESGRLLPPNGLSTVDTGKLIYLISVNVTVGEEEERMMITGMHTVVDIFCVGCGSIVGWKYESAHEKIQKYKEGKFILERFKVLGPDGSMYVLGQEVQVDGSDADDA